MQNWMIDGLIGWGTVAVLSLIISIASSAPYSFFSTIIWSLFVGFLLGTPGGILLGLYREGWIWPAAGGLLTAIVVGLLLRLFKVI